MAGIAFAIVPGIVAEKEKRRADRKDSIENLKKEIELLRKESSN